LNLALYKFHYLLTYLIRHLLFCIEVEIQQSFQLCESVTRGKSVDSYNFLT